MNIAHIDDEQHCLEELSSALKETFSALGITYNKIDSFLSSEALFAHFFRGAYDIIFLDIYMKDETGIDVARKIREKDQDVILIFCTSSNEFAAETYEVGARYYLNKPPSKEKLAAMLKRIDLLSIEKNRSVTLPNGFVCPIRHLIYTEYVNHTVVFHINNGEPQSVYMNHYEAEELLLHYKSFHKVNRGCIINFAMVKKIEGNVFIMQNKDTVPISRRRFKEISEEYTKYRFEKMNEEVGI